jgi:hypothetical protein
MLIRTTMVTAAAAFVVALSYGCTSTITVVDTDAGNPTPEGGTQKDTSKDTNSNDVNADTNPGVSCAPGDVSGFTPAAYVPAAVHKGACTTMNISDFDAACINATTATSAACSAWQKANATCLACIQTPDTASSWGPLIEHTAQKTISINLGGCFELAGSKACGTSFESDRGCDAAACDANCPVVQNDNNVSINALNACYKSADSGGCKTYADQVAVCENDDGGAITQKCLGGTDFDSLFISVAPLFCGP